MNYLLIGWLIQIIFALILLGAVYSLPDKILNFINWDKLIWVERMAIGAIFVIVIMFFSGVLVAIVPYGFRRASSLILIFILLLATLIGLKRAGWNDMCKSSSQQRIIAASTLALAMVALAMAWLPVRLPAELIDGPYVIKQDLPAVRVQHISGTLPIDNAIPHVVSEYFLRDIKFSDERPLMPGQEVSNRPIMVSFLMLPWHAIIAMPPQQHEPLPRFSYVGQSWPDFSKLLNNSNSWAVSVAIGSALNSLLLLVVGAWLVRHPIVNNKMTLLFSLVAVSSPYILIQTFYTWPKSLAGFFVILAYIFILRGLPVSLASLSMALAYWSHPYSIVYFIFFSVWLFLCFDENDGIEVKLIEKKYFKFVAVYIFSIFPWFVWTRLILRIPSDLVAQNLFQHGQSWYDFLWVRMVNAYTTLIPTFLQIYPYDATAVFRAMSVNFSGAIGLVPLFLLTRNFFKIDNISKNLIYPIFLPAIVLVMVFSNLAVPTLHGLQPLVVLGLAYSVLSIGHSKHIRLLFALLSVQVVLNLTLFGRYVQALLKY